MTTEIADPLVAQPDADGRPQAGVPALSDLVQQVKAAQAASALAQLLDCLTEPDLCALFDIKPGTAVAWRKRGRAPPYAVVGNRVLYPRAQLAKFIERQLREHPEVAAGSLL
ncbi:helix-turn-helix domain-containing protein [Ramlibacter sp.]|uniref:helix-turn-helix domain-containing protein n=1 Tax=Ramlibacter sp. TaxID=1917967 RepID=UPI002D5DD56E|nr:helix-turn-helix domain-containing protein [Ramlibacter sp.]HYD75329.1 helix-turn-helix domain-containing protein [Ramlibacter sp.]